GSGISYFPNPFSENLTVTSKNGFHSANLTLYNSLGEKVMEKNNLSGAQLNLNRNNLPAGIYFIRITDGEKCFSGKVIIE
ncbi:MAG TPA: T9SS type A sorting domain-containing protein, partial [Bacteroidia bacterium]